MEFCHAEEMWLSCWHVRRISSRYQKPNIYTYSQDAGSFFNDVYLLDISNHMHICIHMYPYAISDHLDTISCLPPWPPWQGGAGQSILLINEEAMTQISAHRDWCLAIGCCPIPVTTSRDVWPKCQRTQKEKVVLYTITRSQNGEFFSKCFPSIFEELPVFFSYIWDVGFERLYMWGGQRFCVPYWCNGNLWPAWIFTRILHGKWSTLKIIFQPHGLNHQLATGFFVQFLFLPKLFQVAFHTWMFHCWAIPYHAVSPRLTWTTVMERFKAKQAMSMCPGTNMFEDGMHGYTGYTWVFMFS